MQLIENLQRKEIPPYELGVAFKQYCEIYKVSHSELARRLGIDHEIVSQHIQVVTKGSVDLVDALCKGELQFTEAQKITTIPDHKRQDEVARGFSYIGRAGGG